MAKQNDLKITTYNNGISYNIEKFYRCGKYMNIWGTEVSDIDSYDDAVRLLIAYQFAVGHYCPNHK